uniref:Uncharacterized protein n=1 Tax=Bartonella schoenbuchensis (strain DSM 13525 / NCTC 13165 / R1) TaxID=687861 RepID=E6Z1N7_BARSR|nr:hypothetical protein BARSC_190298 [Bartonella schoenbuchensis R1]
MHKGHGAPIWVSLMRAFELALMRGGGRGDGRTF